MDIPDTDRSGNLATAGSTTSAAISVLSGSQPLHAWMTTDPRDKTRVAALKTHLADALHLISDDLYDTDIDALTSFLRTNSPVRDTFHIFINDAYENPYIEHARCSLLWLAAIEQCDASAIFLCRLVQTSPSLSAENLTVSRIDACEAAIRVIGNLVNDSADQTGIFVEEDETPPPGDIPLVDIYDPHLETARGMPIDIQAALSSYSPRRSPRLTDGEYHIPTTVTGTPCTQAAVNTMETSLSARFPWALEQIAAIFRSQRIRAIAGNNYLQFPPTLLIGPPGCGKTTIARAIAEITGLPLWHLSAAGRSGTLELNASSPLLQRSAPSIGVRAMAALKCINPLILVDELDKFSESRVNGDPYSALATLVEHHSSQNVVDDYLGHPVDMSQISWIFTATDAEPILPQLLDRLDIHRICEPTPEHFEAVLKLCLEDIATDSGTHLDHLPDLDPTIIETLKASYKRGRSLRRMKSALRHALGIAEGDKTLN